MVDMVRRIHFLCSVSYNHKQTDENIYMSLKLSFFLLSRPRERERERREGLT